MTANKYHPSLLKLNLTMRMLDRTQPESLAYCLPPGGDEDPVLCVGEIAEILGMTTEEMPHAVTLRVQTQPAPGYLKVEWKGSFFIYTHHHHHYVFPLLRDAVAKTFNMGMTPTPHVLYWCIMDPGGTVLGKQPEPQETTA